jgi:Fe-S oxidoreductase
VTRLHRLPVLEARSASLETCVYCPKLCRAACPVSNAERTETVTPWAKMSATYFAARGDMPLDRELASLAWACTGCGACTKRCDHENDVSRVLGEARAEMMREGLAPEGAERVVRGWDQRAAEHRSRVQALGREIRSEGLSRAHVLLFAGCGYVKSAPEVVRDAAYVASRLLDAPVRLAEGCCGRPLFEAGATRSFRTMAEGLAEELRRALGEGASRIVALEPGCARALGPIAGRLGVRSPTVDLLVDLAHARLGRLPRGTSEEAHRFVDSCELGRHWGRTEEPRELLARVTGRAPAEALRTREAAECSGAGGLLPLTRPETSAAIARARLDEHTQRGGGTLVTTCSQAARRFRASGERPRDLFQVIADAMRRADGHASTP